MKFFTAVIEKCHDIRLYISGLSGAHSQGQSLDELNKNLQEVIEILLEEGEPKFT
jgi:predicted RNase H-like HicB family nuclease